MKTNLCLIIILWCSFSSFAQNHNTGHLIFKGVPIDGSLNQYVLKMKQGGFNHIGTENGTAVLNGDFAGYKDCSINVTTLKDKDLVY